MIAFAEYVIIHKDQRVLELEITIIQAFVQFKWNRAWFA